MSQCFLYIIAENEHGPVKLGFSNDPFKRVKQLQTGSNVVLKIFHTQEIEFKDRIKLEKLLHKAIKHYKVHGEWFSLSVNDAKQEIDFVIIRYTN